MNTTNANELNDETCGSCEAPAGEACEPDCESVKTPAADVYRGITATFSPEDDKLRISAVSRLPRELYERVKAAGFRWAPKQEVFFAVWSPAAEDLAMELAGEIDDEDTSLVERAEVRAERFETYSEKRGSEAERAREHAETIGARFEGGQPILVSHHSEKRARRDKERMDGAMRKAVSLWRTSSYWTERAKGALRAAKYKELPAVRHRRIKGLEADRRRYEKGAEEAAKFTRAWEKVISPECPAGDARMKAAMQIANFDHISLKPADGERFADSLWGALDGGRLTPEDAARIAIETHERSIAYAARWTSHIENRLAYERAMLDEQGGLAADKFDIQIGGRVTATGYRARHGWLVVRRVNRANGRINSVSTNHGVVDVEEVKNYVPPSGGDAEKVRSAAKLPPLVNFDGAGFVHMTLAEYQKRVKWGSASTRRARATEAHGEYRYREGLRGEQIFLTDQKVKDRPPVETPKPVEPLSELPPPERAPRPSMPTKPETPNAFERMAETLKAGGAQIVTAPQLFPTPDVLADRVVAAANIQPGDRILEPSAGTGQLVRAIMRTGIAYGSITVHEINAKLAEGLTRAFPTVHVFCGDFLEVSPNSGRFDAICMNSPFADGADVAHVTHALKFLKPGGRLVAIMGRGVRSNDWRATREFRALIDSMNGTIEDLPDGSFMPQTSVRTCLVCVRRPS